MASASDHRAHAALQPADCLILLPQRLPAAAETSIGPAHYPAECTQSDAFLQPSLRARNGRANSNSLRKVQMYGHLGPPLSGLPYPLDPLSGTPTQLSVDRFRIYLRHWQIREADIGGSLAGPIVKSDYF